MQCGKTYNYNIGNDMKFHYIKESKGLCSYMCTRNRLQNFFLKKLNFGKKSNIVVNPTIRNVFLASLDFKCKICLQTCSIEDIYCEKLLKTCSCGLSYFRKIMNEVKNSDIICSICRHHVMTA